MQIQQLVVALAFPPFGLSSIVFWMYFFASLLLIIGLIKILLELPREHGLDKIMPFGRLFFAIPLAVFGSEHFTVTANVASLVPRWIPAHTFWVYLVGAGFICAALSITVLVQERLTTKPKTLVTVAKRFFCVAKTKLAQVALLNIM